MHIRCPHCQNAVELVGDSELTDVTCPSCGSAFSLLPATETYTPATRTIAHFQLLQQLGAGSFGTVWKAHDTQLDRLVAVKIPRRDQIDPGDAEQFLREARAAAQLRHPQIVAVHEVGRDNGTLYIVSDFIQGATLADRLTAGPVTSREAAELLAQVAIALHHAHEAGVIHRDLKSSNIMLDGQGNAHLMDFGLAKREAGEITMTVDGKILGTAAYMSPEQARGEGHNVDRRTDVYSLGVILFELLTGERPFRGNARMLLHQVIHDDPPSPRKLNNRVPRDLETICLKCLEKEPQKRYATASGVADDLERFQKNEPILARPVSKPERLWRWCGRNKKVAALSSAVLALLLALVAGSIAFAVMSRQSAIVNRQRHDAERARDEARKSAAQYMAERARAEESEQHAVASRKEADENAKTAAEQRALALDLISALLTKVQDQMKDTPATQRLKQDLLGTALNGLRKVAQSARTSQAADPNMALVFQKLGDVFQALGQMSEAHELYEQFHDVVAELAKSDPDQNRAKRNLSLSLSRLGDASQLKGDKEAARKYYAEALKVKQALAEQNPNDAVAQRDVATSYITLALVSEPEEAHALYNQALELRQKLADAATGSARLNRTRDVRIAYNLLAELSLKQNNRDTARQYYDQALKLALELQKAAPKSPILKVDLANTYISLGNSQLQGGEIETAKQNYAEAVNLLGPLAKEDPENLAWQASYLLALARHGDHAAAAVAAEDLRILAPQNYRNLYNVACCYSLCAAAVARQAKGNPLLPADEELQRTYADKALHALLEAAAYGLKGEAGVASDPDLAAVIAHPEYPKLVAALRLPAASP